MRFCSTIAMQIKLLWRFLGFFQRPVVRVMHAMIVVLVILQIGSSLGMDGPPQHAATSGTVAYLASSWHILEGLFLVIFSCVFIWKSVSQRGLKYFFPYLWGETEQLRKDIAASLHFKMVAPRPGGLATAVQGLGIGALLLTVFAGFSWFVLWRVGSPQASMALTLHKTAVILLVLYLIGHGGMAVLHFVVWQRSMARKNKQSSAPQEA